ncbi:hypothetical protein FCM35_KLT00311 [Carex littledalei]|uniref:CCHC-type domain-containing protein n=1 Tax=Carex littledalei TaxID=544730 RepID=A0A833RKN7_9POAL|nr:hypothetical protein FCM35_KLT00311 [Carex littledalei]
MRGAIPQGEGWFLVTPRRSRPTLRYRKGNNGTAYSRQPLQGNGYNRRHGRSRGSTRTLSHRHQHHRARGTQAYPQWRPQLRTAPHVLLPATPVPPIPTHSLSAPNFKNRNPQTPQTHLGPTNHPPHTYATVTAAPSRQQPNQQHPPQPRPTADPLITQPPLSTEIINPTRYHNPPWQNFLEQDPWQLPSPSLPPAPDNPTDTPANPLPLPLPPIPGHPKWRGRCYNCLELGHDQTDCLSRERVCAHCWAKGHQAKTCPALAANPPTYLDPMRPRGNKGEANLPPNRPDSIMAYIPETPQMRMDALDLNRAIVIDARLRPANNLATVQSIVMSTCKSEFPFPITHMVGPQYLLVLPPGSDRHRFLLNYAKHLQDLGYVAYPWTPAINAFALRLKFKVWIELKRLSPQSWNIDHLIPTVSSFGVVLNHASMTRVHSLETMFVVMAVAELSHIPHNIQTWVRGVGRHIQVVVHSWLEEPLPIIPPLDTTPPEEFFNRVKEDNVKAVTGLTGGDGSQGIVAVEFEMLFSIWENMAACDKRDKIETTLRASPLFAAYMANRQTTQTRLADETRQNKGKDKMDDLERELDASILNQTGEETFTQNSPSQEIAHPAKESTYQRGPRGPTPTQNTLPGTGQKGGNSIQKPTQTFELTFPRETSMNQATPQFEPTPLVDRALGLVRSSGPSPQNISTPATFQSPTQNTKGDQYRTPDTKQAHILNQAGPIYTPTSLTNPRTAHHPNPNPNPTTQPNTNPTHPPPATSPTGKFLEVQNGTEPEEDKTEPIEEEMEPIEEEEPIEEVEPIEEDEPIEEVELIEEPYNLGDDPENIELHDDELREHHNTQNSVTKPTHEETGSNNYSNHDFDGYLYGNPAQEESSRGEFDDELEAIAADLALQDQLDAIRSAEEQEQALLAAAAETPVMPQGAEQLHPSLIPPEQTNQSDLAKQGEEPRPPFDQQQPRVRRSKRISEKGEVRSYSVKKPKSKKMSGGAGPSSAKSILEADLIASLKADAIKIAPLQEENAKRIDHYCGIIEGMGREIATTPLPTHEPGNESVLAAFETDSEEDLSEEEEGAD